MNKQLIDAAVSLIQQVGFPIFCCWWFMFRMEKKMDQQTMVLTDVANMLKGLAADQEGG